jgi:D-alanine-D-alanine ligase
MRIGVTYDLRTDYLAMGYSEEATAEFDAPETIDAICQALSGLGFRPVRVGGIRKLTEALVRGERFDAVFNICEGLKGLAREAQVPALLDAYDIPYVFSDPLTLALSQDKSMAKRVVRDHGVRTPNFAVVETLGDLGSVNLAYPLFLKPVSEGSGKGIDENARVDYPASLARVASDLLQRYRQPVLVEEFLPGREFTVGITGTGADASVLGVTEIVRTEKFIGDGYGYRNKEYWEDKVVIRLAEGEAAEAAAEVALGAWRALRCRDGGRVDTRNDAQGRASFIEVNPLAGLRPDYSDLCFIANFKKVSYQDLIGRIMNSFLKRHPELAKRGRAAA